MTIQTAIGMNMSPEIAEADHNASVKERAFLVFKKKETNKIQT